MTSILIQTNTNKISGGSVVNEKNENMIGTVVEISLPRGQAENSETSEMSETGDSNRTAVAIGHLRKPTEKCVTNEIHQRGYFLVLKANIIDNKQLYEKPS